MLAQALFAAVIPAILYSTLIYYVDRYEKEPLWLLGVTFLWGAIPSIIFALIFNAIAGLPFYAVLDEGMADVAVASFVAPLVEESIKGLALLLILWFQRDHIDTLLDGIIYGAMVGMGFAVVENVFYFMDAFETGGQEAFESLIVLRAWVFGLNHSLFTAMTGLGVAVARFNPHNAKRIFAPILGWSAAVFIHFVHNVSASATDLVGAVACIPLFANAWGGVIITLIIIGWSLWQEKQWIQRYLKEEVGLGTITAAQYANANSGFRRFGDRWQSLFRGGFRAFRRSQKFYLTCSQLAYAKQHYTHVPNEASLNRIAQLRGQLTMSNEQ
ncbi:MAG: PrsW family intramembrane metalloprotease [Chloroflexi bacterium]|nr:PrsW family intramembrane metalloprotease [Chloroflexota bacterium]